MRTSGLSGGSTHLAGCDRRCRCRPHSRAGRVCAVAQPALAPTHRPAFSGCTRCALLNVQTAGSTAATVKRYGALSSVFVSRPTERRRSGRCRRHCRRWNTRGIVRRASSAATAGFGGTGNGSVSPTRWPVSTSGSKKSVTASGTYTSGRWRSGGWMNGRDASRITKAAPCAVRRPRQGRSNR